jgi:hypothetical protein
VNLNTGEPASMKVKRSEIVVKQSKVESMFPIEIR